MGDIAIHKKNGDQCLKKVKHVLIKQISRVVWHFRARRKSFPERFGISAVGENHFPNGLEFPRMAKIIS